MIVKSKVYELSYDIWNDFILFFNWYFNFNLISTKHVKLSVIARHYNFETYSYKELGQYFTLSATKLKRFVIYFENNVFVKV